MTPSEIADLDRAAVDASPQGGGGTGIGVESCLADAMGAPADIQETLERHRIMIVDDELLNIEMVQMYLRSGGYRRFVTTTDPRDAIDLIEKNSPDVLLLDLMMPGINGYDVLKAIRSRRELRHLPVIILTASAKPENKLRALSLGATDFLAKPVDPVELFLRVRNTLTSKAYSDQIARYSTQLEEEVRIRTAELETAQGELVRCLAQAAEFRDNDTGCHVLRVGRYARIIGEEMGFEPDYAETLELAAQLHDVGKIGIPDAILLKPGKLDDEEFAAMQQHCAFGERIIRPVRSEDKPLLADHPRLGYSMLDNSTSPVMNLAALIALTHHERWDGTGYPRGLAGADIPIEGRITAVADVFDALSSKRPYKEAFPREKCFAILEEGRGSQFDPQVLDAFLRRVDDVIRTQDDLSDAE